MGKTALITGASRGIGAEIARALYGEGWQVVINYCSSAERARRLQEELPGSAAVQADVSVPEQAQRLADFTEREFGKVDLLVNNAGISQYGLFTDTAPEERGRVVAVDLMGAMNCAAAVLPAMLRRHEGNILNISSMWGVVGASCEVVYSAAKAGLIGFTKALAKEVGPSGIRVNCIAPGAVETDMMADFGEEDKRALAEASPLCRLGTARDVAGAVLFLASERSGFITGQVLGVNGGFVI